MLQDVIAKLTAEINTVMGPDSASYVYWAAGRTGTTADLDPGELNAA